MILFKINRNKMIQRTYMNDSHCVVVTAQFFQDAVSESNLDEMEAEILRNKLFKVT